MGTVARTKRKREKRDKLLQSGSHAFLRRSVACDPQSRRQISCTVWSHRPHSGLRRCCSENAPRSERRPLMANGAQRTRGRPPPDPRPPGPAPAPARAAVLPHTLARVAVCPALFAVARGRPAFPFPSPSQNCSHRKQNWNGNAAIWLLEQTDPSKFYLTAFRINCSPALRHSSVQNRFLPRYVKTHPLLSETIGLVGEPVTETRLPHARSHGLPRHRHSSPRERAACWTEPVRRRGPRRWPLACPLRHGRLAAPRAVLFPDRGRRADSRVPSRAAAQAARPSHRLRHAPQHTPP